MVKDPLYRKILERLNEQGLVGDVFEACMGDVLRDLFPGLVPVPGGKDAGMDGAIADGQGEPFPLVCTTSEKVERNLSENLDSFISRGLLTRKVALATSRKLTPRRRLKLQDLARSKDFTLLQIVEQRGVATRLYRNSRWRQDLLNLPGNPSALSVVPSTRRPLIELEPIGRDADRQWLRETRQDRVLVGQPGSGKTFLLHYEMLKGWEALFLVSDDEGAIADALRDQQPRVVVIDDAHVEPRRIDRLRRLRHENQSFHILAVTWEGGKDAVMEAMGGLPESRTRTLDLLTRDEILQVIKQVGVEAHEDVLRDLVTQSMRKPGLAVTLAMLALQGGLREVLEGRVLRRTLLTAFQELVGKDSANILATFALGGDAGMTLEDAGEVLGKGLEEIGRKTSAMAAGGVLSDLKDGRLAVWPVALRSALIREVFFPDSASPSLPYLKVLERAPDHRRAVEAIVTARHYGARISDSLLRDLVSSAESRKAWQGLAASSEDNALWALREYRGDPVEIAEPALETAPAAAIPVLLGQAALENSAPAKRRNHPIHILTHWICELNEYRPEEPMRRREELARAVRSYLLERGKTSIGVQAIQAIFSPVLTSNRTDAGSGTTIRIMRAPLGIDEIKGVEKLWGELRSSISEMDQESWQHISAIVRGWIYPQSFFKADEVSEAYRTLMKNLAAKVLQDLSPLVQGSPGLAKAMRDLGAKVGIDLGIEEDPVYQILFPAPYDGVDLGTWEASQLKTVQELALDWLGKDPQWVIDKLLFFESEAQKVRQTWPRWTPALCRELAQSAGAPDVWAVALMDRDAAGDLVDPFLKKAIKIQRPGWESLVERCLNSERYVGFALAWLLGMTAPPQNLLAAALEEAPKFIHIVKILCLRREASIPQLMALLTHPDKSVALAAAIGEWLAEPKEMVQEGVLDAWKVAIVDSAHLDIIEDIEVNYRIEDILAKDPKLALAWLQEYFGRSEGSSRCFPAEISVKDLAGRIAKRHTQF